MTDILRVTNLPTYLMSDLQQIYTVHDRDHITDPSALNRIRAMVGGGDAIIDKKLMSLFPALEFISICGVGYDGVDVIGAMERGIKVSHTPGVLNDDVADLALGLMLSIARRIPQADKFVRNSDWVEGPFPLQTKMSCARLGLVGMGRISRLIHVILSSLLVGCHETVCAERMWTPYCEMWFQRVLPSDIHGSLAKILGCSRSNFFLFLSRYSSKSASEHRG
jgi:lactate dehydrogenase-like 2-hydroxyacid dehydrogenase